MKIDVHLEILIPPTIQRNPRLVAERQVPQGQAEQAARAEAIVLPLRLQMCSAKVILKMLLNIGTI